ncbi:Nitrogen permease regulator 2 [Dinochytrium kinnereticum]|nr:Nitrogen permease regulator 2 [Dinochytrium kinnereticum]
MPPRQRKNRDEDEHDDEDRADQSQMDERDGLGGGEEEDDEELAALYDDVQQSKDEKRRLRREYRSLQTALEENKTEFLKADSNKLSEVIVKANLLFKDVKSTQEATLDAKLLIAAADLSAQKASRLKLSGNLIDPDEIVSRVYTKMGGVRLDEMRPHREGDLDTALDWTAMKKAVAKSLRRAPCVEFMLGPLEVEPKARKERKETTRLKKGDLKLTKPKELKADDIEKQVNETATIVKSIAKKLKQLDEINFFEFVINPESFGQSVENLFYVAFLIKDGTATINVAEDGQPYIRLTSQGDDEDEESSSDLSKKQVIFELTEATWRDIVDVYELREPCIPTRAPAFANVNTSNGRCGMEFPPLQALFYSEFHPIQGPKVVYEIPEGFIKTNTAGLSSAVSPGRALSIQNLSVSSTLSPQLVSTPYAGHLGGHGGGGGAKDGPDAHQLDFDAISEYIIPKPVLCNRLVTVSTKRYKVMGYPVSIESQKYERNGLLFNLCFVFDKDADATSYEQLVRKMARVLRSLEMLESRSWDSLLYLDDANMINLKLLPVFPNPEPVKDWQGFNYTKVPFINGVFYVKKIAEVADVETELFSNIYAISNGLNGLLESQDMQAECLQFVTMKEIDSELPPPSFASVFRLYCSFKHGSTVKEWVEENNVWTLNIDIRRLIVFGVVKGFLYRVRKYPIWAPSIDANGMDINGGGDGEQLRRFRSLDIDVISPYSYLDGRCHYDQICTELQMSPNEVDEILGATPNIKFIWR